jgi:hypothetical protein
MADPAGPGSLVVIGWRQPETDSAERNSVWWIVRDMARVRGSEERR